MTYDDDDLLSEPAPKRMGRPRKPRDEQGRIIREPKPPAPPPVESEDDEPEILGYDDEGAPVQQGIVPSVARLRAGVGISFLASIMGKEPRRLHNRLRACPVMRYENHRGKETPIYDFLTAMAYLQEPRVDLRDWIKSQSRGTLPPLLEKTFWEAERTRMRVMEEARHYWHDADVQAVLGRVAIEIKETSLLWIEELPGKVSMSTEDYNALRRQVNEMLDQVQHRLVTMAEGTETKSVAAELDETVDRLNGAAFGIEADHQDLLS